MKRMLAGFIIAVSLAIAPFYAGATDSYFVADDIVHATPPLVTAQTTPCGRLAGADGGVVLPPYPTVPPAESIAPPVSPAAPNKAIAPLPAKLHVCAWISFGMGGQQLDPSNGERYLVARLKAIGIDTMASPYQWSDTQLIVNQILAAKDCDKDAVGGDSLGANEAPAIAAAVVGKHDIDLLFGFQRSEYGVMVDIPSNVLKAVNVYDPVWLETQGLGDAPWKLAAGNTRTVLRTLAIEAMHPDDYGVAQDVIFNYVKALQ